MPFKISRVYTRGGDSGETALVNGERVSKSSLRVEAYGELDELNSILGLAAMELEAGTAELIPILSKLQNELFDLGAELATPSEVQHEKMWTASSKSVKSLETICDEFSRDLSELESFILPGGSKLASLLHLARTVCRRAERSIVKLDESLAAKDAGVLNPLVLQYVNRLSDLFFILARWSLAKESIEPPLWTPAGKR